MRPLLTRVFLLYKNIGQIQPPLSPMVSLMLILLPTIVIINCSFLQQLSKIAQESLKGNPCTWACFTKPALKSWEVDKKDEGGKGKHVYYTPYGRTKQTYSMTELNRIKDRRVYSHTKPYQILSESRLARSHKTWNHFLMVLNSLC